MTERPASFALRVAADAIDGVPLLAMSAAAFVLLTLAQGDSATTESAHLEQVVFALGCLSMPAYLAIEPLTGGTPGKWALGLRVADACGASPTRLRRFGRWGIKLLPWLLVPEHGFGDLVVSVLIAWEDRRYAAAALALVVLVGLGDALLLDPSRRSLVDRLTGTAVISTRASRTPRGFEVLPPEHEPAAPAPGDVKPVRAKPERV